MKKIIALLFVIAPLVTFGQLSTNENYIHTISYTKAFTDSTIGDATEADRIEGVTYYDGIGRAKQSIAVGQGGNKEHVIKHYEYDNVGRQAKSYLPFAMEKALTNKLIVVNPLQENMGFYKTEKYEDTDFPYSQTEYENTTLSRPINIASPGEAWNMSSGHTTKVSYLSNLPEDGVLNFDVIFENNDLAQPKLNYRGSYDKNQLFKTEIKNENWTSSDKENQNIVYNFSDKFGRTILTRAFTETTDATTGVVTYMPVDTYNVYDDYGNLTYVLSPKAVNHLFSSNILVDYNTISISNTALATGTFSSKRGNISASIALDDSQLTFNFISNLRYDGVLKTGKVFEIPMPTPNVSIGEAHGYTFSVLDNHLDIQGSANLSRISVNETFTVDIPAPEVSIDNLVLYNLAYQYKYDVRNRLIERKVPNAGWESIVYDKLNRPVLTQDAKLANQNKWLYVKYDVFNRPVYTGMYTSVESREVLQDSLDNQTVFNEEKVTTDVLDGTNINYSHNVFPTTGISLLSINYYDEYVSGITTPTSVQTLGQTITNTTTGLVTETKERILGTDEWISSIVYYDVKGQPIFTSSTNTYLNTTDEVVILYDFVGNVEETIHKHTFFPINLIVITEDVFAYDHQNRMLTHHQTIKDDTGIVHIEELIEKNTYDELGRVTKVSVGNSESSPLQEVDYTFNIRGWLKRINNPNESLTNDVFAMEINYNTITKDVNNNAVLNNKALFNGNISEIISKTASDDKKRAYGYTYDNLNRLTSATYKAGDNFDQEQNFYNLNSVSYDENGNIKHLSRNAPNSGFNGALQIDDLNYEYFPVSNQLKKVIDLASNADGFDNGASGTNEDYIYDVNGNVTADNNKGISTNNPISFNYLNLPETITVTDKGTINFVYSASGKKQKKTVVNTTTGTHETVYAGKFIYTKDDAIQNYTLKFFSTSQGYVEPNAIGYAYVYQYKDHQGNIRVSYSDVNTDGNVDILRNGIDVNGDSDNRNEIVQAKNYYPFGLDHNYDANSAMSLVNGTIHKYKYNGQEQLKDLGLNVTEMTWRQYDNALGRFHGIDPLAATEPHRTPYHFAGNNPVVFSDPSGLKRQAPGSGSGQMRGVDNSNATIYRTGANRHEGGHWSDALNGGLFSGGGGNTGLDSGQMDVFNSVFTTTKQGYWFYSSLPSNTVTTKNQNYDAALALAQDGNQGNNGWGDIAKGLIKGVYKGITDVMKSTGWGKNLPEITEVKEEEAVAYFAGIILFALLEPSPAGEVNAIKSLVKTDPKLFKLAVETFQGNKLLRKEANGLMDQLRMGNMNPGIGTKNIGKGIFEARSRGGARVYFRNAAENSIEVLGYSSKQNQQSVINQIFNVFK